MFFYFTRTYESLKIIFIYLYVYGYFTYIYVCAQCVWLIHRKARSRDQIPWDWSFRWLWASIRFLEIEPKSFEEQPVLLTLSHLFNPMVPFSLYGSSVRVITSIWSLIFLFKSRVNWIRASHRKYKQMPLIKIDYKHKQRVFKRKMPRKYSTPL